MKLVFSPHYDISLFGIERLHPFDSRKYGRAWRVIQKQLGRNLDRFQVAVPRPVARDDLLTIHSPAYLSKLRRSSYLAQALEVPPAAFVPAWLLNWRILRPMRWAVMGSLVAARAALESGVAVNLSGGYHHAKPDRGEGFCIYSDIAFLVSELRTAGRLHESDRIAYIDLDAHQGNGVCHQFMNDSRVFLFDMYNADIYPQYDREARQRVDCNLPLPHGCPGIEYLRILRTCLPGFLDSIMKSGRTALAIYNAGTDVFAGDALGGLSLSPEQILERDLLVHEELRGREIPSVMLLSGGYSRQSYQLVAATISAAHRTVWIGGRHARIVKPRSQS